MSREGGSLYTAREMRKNRKENTLRLKKERERIDVSKKMTSKWPCKI